MISITNLIALPPLLLVSIPLAVSASVTIPLAFAILFLRGLIVYVELAVALLINFFLFPAHSPSSVSFLNVSSEVNTPGISPSRVKSRLRSAETSNVDYFFHTHHVSIALFDRGCSPLEEKEKTDVHHSLILHH